MKILHINTNDTGGAAKAAIRLHYLLLENNIQSKILFLKKGSDEVIKEAYYYEHSYKYKILFRIVDFLNTIYNRRFTFFKPNVYFNGPDSLFRISSHPLYIEADIIHLHWVIKFIDWKSTFRKRDKKFVWTLHDMNPFSGGEHYQTGYFNDFKLIAKYNLKNKTKWVKETQINIIGPSKWILDQSNKSDVFNNKNKFHIKNPINPQIFTNKFEIFQNENNTNKKSILFVAENPNDKRKGLQILLKALENIKNPNEITLKILGKKPANLNINIETKYLGHLSNDNDLAKSYFYSNVFVISSVEDNSPNTVIESLLCGTPVAGFAVGGIPELVHNNINGFLCNDINSLHQAIENCLIFNKSKEEIRSKSLINLQYDSALNNILEVYSFF